MMEKVNLARNVCKVMYDLRYSAVGKRITGTSKQFYALNDELAKAMTDPNIKNTLSSSPMEAEHVREVIQVFEKSIQELAESAEQFTDEKNPKFAEHKVLRTYIAPAATALMGALAFAVAYKRHLEKEDYQGAVALEKVLAAEKEKKLAAERAASRLTSAS